MYAEGIEALRGCTLRLPVRGRIGIELGVHLTAKSKLHFHHASALAAQFLLLRTSQKFPLHLLQRTVLERGDRTPEGCAGGGGAPELNPVGCCTGETVLA